MMPRSSVLFLPFSFAVDDIAEQIRFEWIAEKVGGDLVAMLFLRCPGFLVVFRNLVDAAEQVGVQFAFPPTLLSGPLALPGIEPRTQDRGYGLVLTGAVVMAKAVVGEAESVR